MAAVAQGIGAVLLLVGSNAFMNAAWYLHLKFKSWPLVAAIFISWGIALAEYCLQVPANRMGHFSHGGPFTAPQLKVIQEGISLSTFAIFSILVLKEKPRWPDAIAFALIFSGVAVSLAKPGSKGSQEAPAPEVALPPAPVAPEDAGAGAPAPEAEQGGRRRRRLLELLPLVGGRFAGGGGPDSNAVSGPKPNGSTEQHSSLLKLSAGTSRASSSDVASLQALGRQSQQWEVQAEHSGAALMASSNGGVQPSSSQQQEQEQEQSHGEEGGGHAGPGAGIGAAGGSQQAARKELAHP